MKDITFPTVVDTENKLASLFGFKIVPNGIFLDKEGTIKLVKQGFSVHNDEHVNAIENLIEGTIDHITLEDEYYQPSAEVSKLEKQLAETKFKLALQYSNNGEKEKALQELDEALSIDPDNFLIRKQRWYIRYPEKFSPTIDIEWQQKQLEREQLEECGPEGCVIPGTTSSDDCYER
ncbi:thioredoxin family protein [Bacillus sp. HMF5848]|nr:thioredoxin family protein [Bacillus sp. HMF5848]RSK27568.1 thioredoxin family protein [Bacillus sp. HMF5848]